MLQHTELPSNQALPKLPTRHHRIITPSHCFTFVHLWGRRCVGGSLLRRKRCGCRLPLLANPTTVTWLFSISLPQMTKYCVMRECENIHSWISHQGGIYGFKFPKRFSGDFFLRSHSFTLFLNKSILKAQPSEWMPFPFAFAWLNAIQAVRHSHISIVATWCPRAMHPPARPGT